MKEIVYLNENSARWQEFEQILYSHQKNNPDLIADLFIQITDDLAYSRTYYPNSATTQYLNSLALKTHQLIYKNKRTESNRIVRFWKYEYPLLFNECHRYVMYSFIVFAVSMLIGFISSANDNTFVRLILGDDYVTYTEYNIQRGEPTAIYEAQNQADMFLGITINNIRVSFMAFVAGIFLSIGSGWILFLNGVMIGSFFYLFYPHGVLPTALSVVFIHGTLELWAIIVAGGAGFLIGNSILFPGTYPRKTSLMRGAKKGGKLVLGLIPLFIVAGFFEGFITRLSHAPLVFRLAIIFASVAFIVWYFFIYPNQMKKMKFAKFMKAESK